MEHLVFAGKPKVEGRTLSGIAYAFGQKTLRGSIYHAFSKAGFLDALSRSDVFAFLGHDTNRILGRQSAGTVRLDVAPEGVAYEIDLPDTQDGRDAAVLVERGDLGSMSFGVIPGKYTTSKASDGKQVRTYQSFDWFDISPVAIPAFEGTSIALHSQGGEETPRSQAIRARHRARTSRKETN